MESLPCYRNVSQDLLFFRSTFRIAEKAAKILGVDPEWQRRWHEGLKHVPDYKIIEYGGKKRIADHKEQTAEDIYTQNTFLYAGYIAGPLIYPGEDVDPESDSELATLVREAMEDFDPEEAFTHNFLAFSLDVPAARLKMAKAYHMVRHAVTQCRYPTGTPAMFNLEAGMSALQHVYPYGLQVEDFTMPFVISELLLQSYGEVIRLFPAWPKDKWARFTSLRTEGGFLVSSKVQGGRIGLTRVKSTVGGRCRVQWTWGEPRIYDEAAGEPVSYTYEGDLIYLDTEMGHTYRIEA